VVLLLATTPEWESIEQSDQCWVLESEWQGCQNLVRSELDWNEEDTGILSGAYSEWQNN
jgi:hypothetical protein